MAYSYQEHVGNGTTGPYSYGSVALLDASVESIADQLDVYKNGVLLTITTDYTINTGAKTVTLTAAAFASDLIRIARNTKKDARYVDWVDSTNVTAELLDLDSNQLFYTMQEAYDIKNDSIVLDTDGAWNGRSKRIKNVSAGIYGSDVVNLNQLNAAIEGGVPANLAGYGVVVYTGNGTNKNFKLPAEISDPVLGIGKPAAEDFTLHVAGLRLTPRTDYDVVGNEAVLDASVSAPSVGQKVIITFPKGAVAAILTANSVFNSSLQPKCVTVDKINNGSNGQFLRTTGSAVVWDGILASNISDFNTAVRTSRLDQMAIPTADVNVNSNKLLNVATPTASSDGANKQYVDGLLTNVVSVTDFTPDLLFGGNAVSLTYAAGGRVGRVVKIGKLVHVSIYIKLSNKGTSTGAAAIGSLPYAVDTTLPIQPLSWNPVAINTGAQIYVTTGSTNSISLRYNSTGTTFTDLTHNQFTNSSEFHIAGTYISA